MAHSYHNIDRALPSKFYHYVGWDAAGRRFVIQKLYERTGYRAAQVIMTDPNSTPYFYARTLKEVSAILETLN